MARELNWIFVRLVQILPERLTTSFHHVTEGIILPLDAIICVDSGCLLCESSSSTWADSVFWSRPSSSLAFWGLMGVASCISGGRLVEFVCALSQGRSADSIIERSEIVIIGRQSSFCSRRWS